MGAGYRFIAKAADKSAEFFLYEDIGADWFGGVTAQQFATDLRAAGKVDSIDVRIASYGGDMNDGYAIYRLLAEHEAKVTVHIDGVAASIASVIAMAGKQIVIAESGSLMIHEGWTIAAGNARELRAVADVADAMTKQMADVYVARTRNPLSKVTAWMEAETWFHGKEAVEAGFADSIAENVRMAASARSVWLSTMQSRVAQHVHMSRTAAPSAGAKPHPANDDVRASLAALTHRAQARRLRAVT